MSMGTAACKTPVTKNGLGFFGKAMPAIFATSKSSKRRLAQAHSPLKALLPNCSIEAQKSSRVVIQNVPLLLRRQIVRVLDDTDRVSHQLRPDQLVSPEHHSVFKSSLD